MIREICKHNHKALKTKCTPIVINYDIQIHRLQSIIQDMIDTMIEGKGIGISAPQIGITERIIVVTDTTINVPFGVINPEIIFQEGSAVEEEGCLSYPAVRKLIRRPTHIKVKGLVVYGYDLKEVEYDAFDLQARIFCHEIDHLNGNCKVNGKKRVM